MPSTSRFGLTLGDILSDHDKSLLDAVLAAFELHDHTGGNQLADPTGPPTGTLSSTGGSLPAGVTYYYRLAYIDRYGLETAASNEVAFTTASPVPAPAVPTLVTSAGGSLNSGVYYYALTGVDANGNETALSTPATVTIIADSSTVTVTGRTPFLNSATGYNVWRKGPRTSAFSLVGSITDATTGVFTDNGAIADDPYIVDPTRIAPTVNRTNATGMVTLAPADPTLTGITAGPVKAWRLYRTTTSGTYPNNSLLAEVSTSVNIDGTGGLLPSFIDDGTTSLAVGKPQEYSQTLHPSVKIAAGAGNSAITLASATYKWRLYASLDGTLTTEKSAALVGSGNLYLGSPLGSQYQVTVNDAGALSTAVSSPVAGDTLYLDGSGPLLPTSSGVIDYRLGVTDAGVLTSTAIGTAPAVDSNPNTLTANTRTASYTLDVTDVGKVVEMNSTSSTTITIPPNSVAPFAVGSVLEIANIGTGSVTVAAGAGVVIQSTGGRTALTAQYSGATLRQRSSNTWLLIGVLS